MLDAVIRQNEQFNFSVYSSFQIHWETFLLKDNTYMEVARMPKLLSIEKAAWIALLYVWNTIYYYFYSNNWIYGYFSSLNI